MYFSLSVVLTFGMALLSIKAIRQIRQVCLGPKGGLNREILLYQYGGIMLFFGNCWRMLIDLQIVMLLLIWRTKFLKLKVKKLTEECFASFQAGLS